MLDALTLFNPFDPILLDDSWYFALGYKEASLPLWKLKCPCWIWFLPCHAAYFYLDSLHWGSSDQTSSQMSSIPTAFWNCCLSSEYPRWCYCFLSLELTKWALNLGEKVSLHFCWGGVDWLPLEIQNTYFCFSWNCSSSFSGLVSTCVWQTTSFGENTEWVFFKLVPTDSTHVVGFFGVSSL